MPRNSLKDETSLLSEAISRVRDAVPATWTVERTSAPEPFDGAVKISGGATTATFVVESKRTLRASTQDTVNRLRALTQGAPAKLLFVTEYINAPLRKACERWRISYVDTTGWAYISNDEPPVLIRLEGAAKPPKPRENTPTSRLNGISAGRAIRQLLEEDPPLGIRQLAIRSSSSPAAVSRLMKTLVDAGAVDRSRQGTITYIRRRTLLDRWTADYKFLNSNDTVLDYLAPRGLTKVMEKVRDRNDICITGSAAARTFLPDDVTPVVPFRLLTMYGRDADGIADGLGLVRTERQSSNVIIATPQDRTLLGIGFSPGQRFPVAPLGLVLADLLTMPGRLAEEAEQLIDSIAETDPAWRE